MTREEVFNLNVIDALQARSTVRAYKLDPVGKDTILKILEAAVRAPSWANTQPWDIFVAAGEALETLRTEYTLRSQKRVPSNPDLPAPQTWPPVIRQRMAELMSEQARLIRTDSERDEATVRQSLFASNYRFFSAPVVFFAWIATFRPGHFLTWDCWHRVFAGGTRISGGSSTRLPFRIVTLILFVQN